MSLPLNLMPMGSDDTTSSVTKESDDTTRRITSPKESDNTTVPEESDNTTSTKRSADTTREQLSVVSAAQETHETTKNADQHDNQDDTIQLFPLALPYTQAQNAPRVEGQQRSQSDLLFHDATASAVIQQENQDEKSPRHNAARSHAVAPHTTGDQKRQTHQPLQQKTGHLSHEPAPASRPEATTEHDTLTTRILAYLAEHDHAKQADIAEALGVTVRTVQRKLTALKNQQADR